MSFDFGGRPGPRFAVLSYFRAISNRIPAQQHVRRDECGRASQCASISIGSFLLIALAGWINREQLAIIEYLAAENRVLRDQLGKHRLRFTDDERRSLTGKANAIGRKALKLSKKLRTWPNNSDETFRL